MAPAAAAPRILSLLPSATEIVGALGLADSLVGVTHECDVCPDEAGFARVLARGGVERVTTSAIDPATLGQAEIDLAVRASLEAGESLYGLSDEALRRANPDVVLTQALCAVCAPAYDDVAAACTGVLGVGAATIVNLEPADLAGVADTFVQVAEASGVPDRGVRLKADFFDRMSELRAITARASTTPRTLFLEWLDPPFDGGHWVPEQIEAAGGECVSNGAGGKSAALDWERIEALDPDVVLVGCCGFDQARNEADIRRLLAAPASPLGSLRAVREGRLFALDGNRHFARPAPSLAHGAALMASCIHAADPTLVGEVDALEWLTGPFALSRVR